MDWVKFLGSAIVGLVSYLISVDLLTTLVLYYFVKMLIPWFYRLQLWVHLTCLKLIFGLCLPSFRLLLATMLRHTSRKLFHFLSHLTLQYTGRDKSRQLLMSDFFFVGATGSWVSLGAMTAHASYMPKQPPFSFVSHDYLLYFCIYIFPMFSPLPCFFLLKSVDLIVTN